MYKGVGVRFADSISFFLNIPYLTETKLFHFHRIFKNLGRGGVRAKYPNTMCLTTHAGQYQR